MRTDVVAILTNARDRLEKGWIQHKASDHMGGRVCAAQAITLAVTEKSPNEIISFYPTPEESEVINELTGTAGRVLLDAALERTDQDWPSIPMWNDFPYRDHQEVIDTFDHAIKLAERNAA